MLAKYSNNSAGRYISIYFPSLTSFNIYIYLKIVGLGQTPRLIHKDQLHYINAVIHESMRLTCLGYFAIPHFTSADVSIKEYVIPKGTLVLPSLMHVMLDEDHFPNPHKFNPNRFLDEDGVFQNDEHVIPFGVGKRACLGQSLAEKELFLFFVGLMQKFDINPEPNQCLPSYRIQESNAKGLVRTAPPFNLILTNRSA